VGLIPSLEEFIACCDAEYGYLVREFGFERLLDPMEYNPFSVCFRKGELGVDIYGENWGQNASCDLVRGKDRLYLWWIVPAPEREKYRSRHRRAQLEQVSLLAAVLRQHAPDFLAGDFSRFDAAFAEWTRVTRPRPVTEAQRQYRALQTAVTEAGHASKRGDHAEVVRLLEPHAAELSQHQRRMLDDAREKLKGG
jgi:hypothetical protein